MDVDLDSFKIPFVCELGIDLTDDLQTVLGKAKRLVGNGASAIVIEDSYYLKPNPYHDRIVMDSLKFKAFVKGIREQYDDLIVIVKLHDYKAVYVENGDDYSIKDMVLGATTDINPIRDSLQMARAVGAVETTLTGMINLWKNEARLMTLPQAIEFYAYRNFSDKEVESKITAWKESSRNLTLTQSINLAHQQGFHNFYFNLESTRSELGYYQIKNSTDSLCTKLSHVSTLCDVVLLQDNKEPSLNFIAALAYNLHKLFPDLVLAYQYPLLEATNIDTDAYFNELSGFVNEFLNMGITWQLLAWQPKASKQITNEAKNFMQRSTFVNGFSNTLHRTRELINSAKDEKDDEENDVDSTTKEPELVVEHHDAGKWPVYYRELVQKLLDEIGANYYNNM